MNAGDMFALSVTIETDARALEPLLSKLDVIRLFRTGRHHRPDKSSEVVSFEIHICEYNRVACEFRGVLHGGIPLADSSLSGIIIKRSTGVIALTHIPSFADPVVDVLDENLRLVLFFNSDCDH